MGPASAWVTNGVSGMAAADAGIAFPHERRADRQAGDRAEVRCRPGLRAPGSAGPRRGRPGAAAGARRKPRTSSRATTTPVTCGWPRPGLPCAGAAAAMTPAGTSSCRSAGIPGGRYMPRWGMATSPSRPASPSWSPAWAGDSQLHPVATLETRRTVWQIAGPDGEVLAELADDHVTGHREALPATAGPGRARRLTWPGGRSRWNSSPGRRTSSRPPQGGCAHPARRRPGRPASSAGCSARLPPSRPGSPRLARPGSPPAAAGTDGSAVASESGDTTIGIGPGRRAVRPHAARPHPA